VCDVLFVPLSAISIVRTAIRAVLAEGCDDAWAGATTTSDTVPAHVLMPSHVPYLGVSILGKGCIARPCATHCRIRQPQRSLLDAVLVASGRPALPLSLSPWKPEELAAAHCEFQRAFAVHNWVNISGTASDQTSS
jgi:hypothetical protein